MAPFADFRVKGSNKFNMVMLFWKMDANFLRAESSKYFKPALLYWKTGANSLRAGGPG